MWRALALGLLTLAVAPIDGAAQDVEPRTVVVVVRDGQSGVPLSGATVAVGEASVTTDANGRAVLGVVGGDAVTVAVGLTGYEVVEQTAPLRAEGVTYVVFDLEPPLRQLGGVEVSAESLNDVMLERRGFFERRDSRTGVFLTRDELDARNMSQFSDMFTGLSGVRIDRGRGLSRLVSTRRPDCPMTVFMDGIEAQYLAENVDAFPFGDVAAVEVYRGPSEVPIQYAHTRFNKTCGAVLIWTQIQNGG